MASNVLPVIYPKIGQGHFYYRCYEDSAMTSVSKSEISFVFPKSDSVKADLDFQ